MKTLDPGHRYSLHVLDQKDGITEECLLTFVKREGFLYPGNVGKHPGTILQEAWRAEIARLKYLDAQAPCPQNTWCLSNLRQCIYYLEIRAAQRHETDFALQTIDAIEDLPICPQCGHIFNHLHPDTGVGISTQVFTPAPRTAVDYMVDDRHKVHQSPG